MSTQWLYTKSEDHPSLIWKSVWWSMISSYVYVNALSWMLVQFASVTHIRPWKDVAYPPELCPAELDYFTADAFDINVTWMYLIMVSGDCSCTCTSASSLCLSGVVTCRRHKVIYYWLSTIRGLVQKQITVLCKYQYFRGGIQVKRYIEWQTFMKCFNTLRILLRILNK